MPERKRRALSGRMETAEEQPLLTEEPITALPEEPAPAEPAVLPEEPVPPMPSWPSPAPHPPRDLMATNTGVRLACTMAAMLGLFAIFLCWAEKESRVIRRFAVQSAALTALHGAAGAVCLLAGLLLGGIPYFGLMVRLTCLLVYIACLVLLMAVRVKMMRHAWMGVRFRLPRALERRLHRYYGGEGKHAP